MKTEKKILTAFILNFAFSVFELAGGIFTGSVAILSDAIHDFGDAAGIGTSYFLEKKSRRQPDESHTYGYARYSVLGSVITTLILLFGSAVVIYNAVCRLISPREINFDGMIIFAVAGVCINLCAAYFTRGGDSLNQKAVNLHMLEDVLGWAVVLAGAVIMRFTDWWFIDPVMSVGVSIFILTNAAKNLKDAVDLFLEKTPLGISVAEIAEHISAIDGVIDVHHIHLRSLDGQCNYATMHIVTDSEPQKIKKAIREELREHGISHATLELEATDEPCDEKVCTVEHKASNKNCHHHHH